MLLSLSLITYIIYLDGSLTLGCWDRALCTSLGYGPEETGPMILNMFQNMAVANRVKRSLTFFSESLTSSEN